jgi:hypothetical protein
VDQLLHDIGFLAEHIEGISRVWRADLLACETYGTVTGLPLYFLYDAEGSIAERGVAVKLKPLLMQLF